MADTPTYTPPAGITLDPKLVSATNPAGAPLINGVPQWIPPQILRPPTTSVAPPPPSQQTAKAGDTWTNYTNLTPGVATGTQKGANPSEVIADMRAHGAPDSVIAQFSSAWGRGGVLTPETAGIANVAITNVNTTYQKGGQDAFNLAIQQGKIPAGSVYVPPTGSDQTKWSYLTENQANQYIKDLVNKGAIVNVTKDINTSNPNLYSLLQNLDKSFANEYNAAVQAAGNLIKGNQIDVTGALSSGRLTTAQLQTLGVPKDTISQAQMALRNPPSTEPVIPAASASVFAPTTVISNLDSVIKSINSYNVDQATKDYLTNLAQQGNVVALNAAIGNINQGITFRNQDQATAAINSLPNLDKDTKSYLMGFVAREDYANLNAAISNVSQGTTFKNQQLLIPARTDQTQNTNILGYTGSYDPTVIAKLNLTDKQLTTMGFSDKQIVDIKTSIPQVATVKTPAPSVTGTIAPSFISAVQGARTGVIPTQVVSGRQTGNLGLPAPSFSPVTPKPSSSGIMNWINKVEPTGGVMNLTPGLNLMEKGTSAALGAQVSVPPSLGRFAYGVAMATPLAGTTSGTLQSFGIIGGTPNAPTLTKLPSLGQVLGLPETNIALGTLGGLAPMTSTSVQMEQVLRQVSVLPKEVRADLFANNPELEAAYNARITGQKTAAFESRVAEAQAQKVTAATEANIASKIRTGETPYATGISSITTERFLQRFGQPAPSFPKITPSGQATIGIISTVAGMPSSAPITAESLAAMTPVSTIATKATPVVTSLRLPTEVGISSITVPVAVASTVTQKTITPTVTTQTQVPQAVTVTPTISTVTQVTPANPLASSPSITTVSSLPKFTPVTQTTQTISSLTPAVKTVTTSPLFTPTTIQVQSVVQPQVQVQQPSFIPVPTRVQVTPSPQIPSPQITTPSDIFAPTVITAPTVIPATVNNIIGTPKTEGTGDTTMSAPPPFLPIPPFMMFPQLRNTAGTSGGGGYPIERKKQLRKLFQYIPATVVHLPEFKGGISTKDILGESTKVLTTRREVVVAPSVRLKAGATEAASSTYRGRSITNRNFSPMG